MNTAQLVGIAFFAPMMFVTFFGLGYHYYSNWKQNKKGPMAVFNKR